MQKEQEYKMHAKKTKDKGEKEQSNFNFAEMAHGISEMVTKCCAGRGGFPDCLTMMEEMKKQCCAPHKDAVESERKKR